MQRDVRLSTLFERFQNGGVQQLKNQTGLRDNIFVCAFSHNKLSILLYLHIYTELISWELTSWEVDLDLVGVDLVGGHRTYFTVCKGIANVIITDLALTLVFTA